MKKYSLITEKEEAVLKSDASYPIDQTLQDDLNVIVKHFNDSTIKEYKSKILNLFYSTDLSRPKENKYYFLTNEMNAQKNLLNITYTDIKFQLEVTVNKRPTKEVNTKEGADVSKVEETNSKWDAKIIIFLYWKDIRKMKTHYTKAGYYKIRNKKIYFISLEDNSNIQQIGNAKYFTV